MINPKHEAILDTLESRIKGYERYSFVTRNFEYHTPKFQGEVDLLAYDSRFDKWHFYEVKSTDKRKTTKKARKQYERFTKAFPSFDVEGVLVNTTGVYRL